MGAGRGGVGLLPGIACRLEIRAARPVSVIGKQLIAKNGAINPDYDEGPTAKYMAGENIEITVNAGVGKAKATVWTCDLTHEYISINADYRT